MKRRQDERHQTPASQRPKTWRASTPLPRPVSAPLQDSPQLALTSDMPITIPLGAATALFNRIAALQKEAKHYRTKYEQLLALGPRPSGHDRVLLHQVGTAPARSPGVVILQVVVGLFSFFLFL